MRRPPIVLAGSVYLDISIHPVAIDALAPREFSDLDRVWWQCGGSAYHVGRHLWEAHKRRSRLFSRIGDGDPFSAELTRRLKAEKWIRGDNIGKVPNEQCGVSIHLESKTFHTTFTHKGALASFSWNSILRALQRRTKRGGLLYISGFFRTNLCEDFARSVKALSPDVLICVDHGRFQLGDNRKAAHVLKDAFANWIG